MNPYLLRCLSAATAGLLLLGGCGLRPAPASTAAPAPVASPAPVLTQAVNVPWFEADSLNPYTCQTLQNYYLAGLLCDPLVALDSRLEPQNRLALEIIPDKNNYALVLRHDAVFSDGTALTPQDVLYSLKLAQASPRFAAGLAGVEKAEATPEGTVLITLKSPDIFFPRSLTFPVLREGTGELAVPVGVGRFSPRTEQGLFVRNDSYYSPVKNVRQLSLVPTDSLETQSFAIMEGSIDLMYSDLQGDLNLGLGIAYRQIPLSNMVYLGVNGKNAGGDPKVRQALSGLISRDELARKVYMGFASSTSLPISPAAAVTTLNTSDLEVNREKQQALLEQSGWKLTEGVGWFKAGNLLRFELLVNAESDERISAAELIVHACKEAHIPVTVVSLPFDQYSQRIAKGEYDLYMGEVRLSYNMDLSPLIFPGGSLNPAAPENPALAALYSQVHSGTAQPVDLEEALRGTLPVIPLLFRRGILCFSRDFSANIVATEQDIFYNVTDW